MKCEYCSWEFDEQCDVFCSGCGRDLKRFWVFKDLNCQTPLKCERGDCKKDCADSIERHENKRCDKKYISFNYDILAADEPIPLRLYLKNTGQSDIKLNVTPLSGDNKAIIKSLPDNISKNKSNFIEFLIPAYNENASNYEFEIYDVVYPEQKTSLIFKNKKRSKIKVWFENPGSKVLIFETEKTKEPSVKMHIDNEGDEDLIGDLGSELKILDEKQHNDYTDFFIFKNKSYQRKANEKSAIDVFINFDKLSQIFGKAFNRNQGDINKKGEYEFKFNLKFSKDAYEYVTPFNYIFWYPGRIDEHIIYNREAKLIFENKPLKINEVQIINIGYADVNIKNYEYRIDLAGADKNSNDLIEITDFQVILKDQDIKIKDNRLNFKLSINQDARFSFIILLKDYKKIKELLKCESILKLDLIIETSTEGFDNLDKKFTINLMPEELKIYHHYIGIDFGTSNSCMAYVSSDVTKETKNIKFENDEDYLESVIYFESEHKLPLIGSPARKNSWIKSGLAKKSIKSLLSEKFVHFIDGQIDFTKKPRELFEFFAKHMIETVENQLRVKTKKYVISVPVTFGGQEKKIIEEVFKKLSDHESKPEIKFLPEPVAYSISHIIKNIDDFNKEIKKNKSVLILNVDYGGGTINFALIKIENNSDNKFVPSIEGYAGLEKNGGDAIDKLIRDKLIDKFKGSKNEKIAGHFDRIYKFLNSSNENDIVIDDCFKLLELSEKIKIKFPDLSIPLQIDFSKYLLNSEKDGISITFKYSDSEKEIVKLTIEEYKKILDIKFAEIQKKIRTLLKECKVNENDLKWMVLSGQTFKNNDIRKLFEDEFKKTEISYDEKFCKTGVSLGAAQYAESRQIDISKISESFENKLFDSYGYRFCPKNENGRLNPMGSFKTFTVSKKHKIIGGGKLFLIPSSDLECINCDNLSNKIDEIEILKCTVNSIAAQSTENNWTDINEKNEFLFKSIGKIESFNLPVGFNDINKTKRLAIIMKTKNINTEEYEVDCVPLEIKEYYDPVNKETKFKTIIPEGSKNLELKFAQYIAVKDYKNIDKY